MSRNLPRCSCSNAHCTNTHFFPAPPNSYAQPLLHQVENCTFAPGFTSQQCCQPCLESAAWRGHLLRSLIALVHPTSSEGCKLVQGASVYHQSAPEVSPAGAAHRWTPHGSTHSISEAVAVLRQGLHGRPQFSLYRHQFSQL